MKILFINNFRAPDYLNDCLFHGLNNIDVELSVTSKANYMLKSFEDKKHLYGKGFTVFGTLDECPTPEDSEVVANKINDHYYDLVVYGSLHRDRSYENNVLQAYSKEEILSFDGEDFSQIYEPFVEHTTYFKRENVSSRTDVKDISFSIPKEKILDDAIPKDKMFATVVPGKLETYVFENEEDYYRDYASSYYGYTWKKAGWDCMRHYEILAARCVPAFKDLEKCPDAVMSNFPKEQILEANEYSLNEKIHPNYSELVNELVEYTKNNLTTEAVARRLFL